MGGSTEPPEAAAHLFGDLYGALRVTSPIC
jgi:hypothetical protein